MPLLWLSLAFLGGFLLASSMALPVPAWLVMGGAALGLAGVVRFARLRFPAFWDRLPRWNFLPRGISILALLGVLCLGAARYQAAQPELSPQAIAYYNDRQETWVVRGVVNAPPQPRLGYTRLRLRVDEMRQEDALAFQPVKGTLLVLADPGDWAYGDRLQVHGVLRTPQSSDRFDYRGWLARQGIYSQMSPGEIRP